MTVWAGVFGKYPGTGDFIAMGLSAPLRAGLDRWLTRHLAGHDATLWPEGGVRALAQLTDEPALILAVPSRDSVARRFPLAAATAGRGLSWEAAEAWCDRLAPVLTAVAAGEEDIAKALDFAEDARFLPRMEHDEEDEEFRLDGRRRADRDRGDGAAPHPPQF